MEEGGRKRKKDGRRDIKIWKESERWKIMGKRE